MAITVDTKNKVEPHWHTLKSQNDEEKPAEFKIYAVKGGVLDEVMEGIDFDVWPPLKPKGIRTALMYGVKGCRNVFDPEGEEIKYSPSLLESVPWGDRIELAMAVLDKSKLTDEEIKN